MPPDRQPPSQARRDAARARIARITRATAVGAALSTGAFAVLASGQSSLPPAAARTATATAAAQASDDAGTTLAAPDSLPTITDEPPVAASGGS